MRKMLAALLLLIAFTFTSPAAVDVTPDVSAVTDLMPWNRAAMVKGDDGKTYDLGPHEDNPFKNKAACVDGIAADTATIYLFLVQLGLDPAKYDVVVTCTPAKGTGI